MGDPLCANRRLTGYGPIRLPCGVLKGFRMAFASFLSLLLLVMIVFFIVLFDAGFLGAGFAPIGPCVASVEGYASSGSLASRKAGCAAPFRVALPGVLFNSSACHHRALASLAAFSASFGVRRSPFHGTADETAPISGLRQSDPANPTQFVVGLNGTVVDSGGLHVLR